MDIQNPSQVVHCSRGNHNIVCRRIVILAGAPNLQRLFISFSPESDTQLLQYHCTGCYQLHNVSFYFLYTIQNRSQWLSLHANLLRETSKQILPIGGTYYCIMSPCHRYRSADTYYLADTYNSLQYLLHVTFPLYALYNCWLL